MTHRGERLADTVMVSGSFCAGGETPRPKGCPYLAANRNFLEWLSDCFGHSLQLFEVRTMGKKRVLLYSVNVQRHKQFHVLVHGALVLA